MHKLLKGLLDKSSLSWRFPRVFVRPEIPPRLLRSAINCYAKEALSEDVLLLIDDSSDRRGGEGLLFTTSMMYLRTPDGISNSIVLSEIKEIRVRGEIIGADLLARANIKGDDTKRARASIYINNKMAYWANNASVKVLIEIGSRLIDCMEGNGHEFERPLMESLFRGAKKVGKFIGVASEFVNDAAISTMETVIRNTEKNLEYGIHSKSRCEPELRQRVQMQLRSGYGKYLKMLERAADKATVELENNSDKLQYEDARHCALTEFEVSELEEAIKMHKRFKEEMQRKIDKHCS